MDFKAPRELWNPLIKAVSGKFHGSGGHNKRISLQNQANVRRSRTRQIVLISNTAIQYLLQQTMSLSCLIMTDGHVQWMRQLSRRHLMNRSSRHLWWHLCCLTGITALASHLTLTIWRTVILSPYLWLRCSHNDLGEYNIIIPALKAPGSRRLLKGQVPVRPLPP